MHALTRAFSYVTFMHAHMYVLTGILPHIHTHIHAAYIHTHADLHPLTCFTHGDACVSENFLGPLLHTSSSIFASMSACVLQLTWTDVCEMLSEILPGTFLFGIKKKN